MNIRKKRFYFLIAFLTIGTVVFAQNVGTNSPYSRYGYGLMMNPVPSASEAMGGIGYGLRRSQEVNWTNPASYSRIDSLTFIFDVGASGHLALLNDGVADPRNFYNGNLDFAAMQFPLFRKMGASIGLLPFSKMGYNFAAGRSLSNMQYREVYRGTGGLNQLYAGLAWEPFRNFSIGANLSYLFGNFSRSSVVIPNAGLVGETKHLYSFHELKYDLGIQYTYAIDKTRSLTFGAVYSPQLNMKSDVKPTEMLYISDPYDSPLNSSPAQILKSDTLSNASFQLPHTFGAGFTYSNGRFLVGLDGTYQLWKELDYPDVLDNLSKENRFNNAFRVNAGMEYVIDPMSQNFFHRIRFRGGLSFANSYSNVSVNDPNDLTGGTRSIGSFNEYGINVGLGLPFMDYMSGRVSMLNIGFGYSRQQPDIDHMVRQDMLKVSVSMNINEMWFFKRQFN